MWGQLCNVRKKKEEEEKHIKKISYWLINYKLLERGKSSSYVIWSSINFQNFSEISY